MLAEERAYAISKEIILNGIWDMAELQKGRQISSDPANEEITFFTEMYGFQHHYHFIVRNTPDGCLVRLKIDEPNAARLIYRAFALLESLMANQTERKEDPV